ncbi:endoplasmic reticulum junction formation protein lunapark-B isoform X2 [Episyrphus balteatus]|uniref:endoplasmic reticulum junction formation protein lunapark-B isoform X2 n=1 Tax=Episyrphus balteatus TaxID=286459 RepID=UPI002485998C|nr:endoplasmic reticulum junction formation protein lunapark-B isoform X2 [Episyrphus balteatus]
MGAVLAKFRKEKSSADVLEKLETEINTIEKYSISTQEKQRRLVGNFLVISIGLYAIGFFIIFFVFFPTTWPDRITYSVPLLAFPLIIFLVRRLLAWFFQRKINKNQTKLVKLRAEKKKILEQVMEKETYNVASKLLSKYGGDKSYGIKSLTTTAPTPQQNKSQTTENRILNLNSSLAALSNRPGGGGPGQTFGSQVAINQSLLSAAANNGSQSTISPLTPRSTTTQHTSGALRYRGVATPARSNALALPNTRPYPIINQKSQGLLEKMVDYLIGDGPQNRYALICKECFAHNGMARQEDFDYATFRCAFCNELNPSRKSRPVAPKLTSGMSPLHNRMIAFQARNSGSSSESSDDSDVPRRIENITSQKVPEQTAAEKKEQELESENNNQYSNTNGSSLPSEEHESKPSSETETEKPSLEEEAEKIPEVEEAIKESETKQ